MNVVGVCLLYFLVLMLIRVLVFCFETEMQRISYCIKSTSRSWRPVQLLQMVIMDEIGRCGVRIAAGGMRST
jgi:hypothetical protein